MSIILASLFSRKSMSAGLMVYDIATSSPHYLQLLDFNGLPTRVQQLRGISLAGDRLFALTPCALLIFRVNTENAGPALTIEKTVCRPEWILGDIHQGDLHAVYASTKKQRVYISFNARCAIDVLDLDGNFIKREYLWDIAPKLFPVPSTSIDKNFRFGVVRHIFESEEYGLMLTIALMNGNQDSAVISYERGSKVLFKRSLPLHGGFIDKNFLYLCAIQKGEVQAFTWPLDEEDPVTEPVRRFHPQIKDSKWNGSDQKTRGLAIQNNHLLCGVCYFGKPKPRQIPPRMVEFDLESGKQIREHWLPSFQGLESPHIYALHPVSKELVHAMVLRKGPMFFRGEEAISPDWTNKDAPSKIPKNNPSMKILSTIIDDKNRLPTNIQHEQITIPDLKPPEELTKPTVIFEDVGLCFERSARKFLSFNKNLRSKKIFWALRDISFTIREGETLGVIGRNGSGKSTLSMICGGVLQPDKGKVIINGRTQLLSLGVGFKVELSGRENVFISASLLGLKKKEIETKMDEIEAFAELGEYMDEPVRTYSSGMRSRLGFAVATAVKPDILILDEILATGDKAFRDKAMKRMSEMRQLARSIVIVSHNPGQLKKLSTKVLWLERGRIMLMGEPKVVLNAYENFCKNPDKWLKSHSEKINKVIS